MLSPPERSYSRSSRTVESEPKPVGEPGTWRIDKPLSRQHLGWGVVLIASLTTVTFEMIEQVSVIEGTVQPCDVANFGPVMHRWEPEV